MHQQLEGVNYYHVYSDHAGRDNGSLLRHHVARMTWGDDRLIPLPVHDSDLKRTSKSIGDTRSLPFVRDVLDFAVENLFEEDTVVFTNDDTCLCVGFVDIMIPYLAKAGCCYGHRRDFDEITRPLTGIEIRKGGLYPGVDLFAFKVAWWEKVRGDFPDLIIGCQWWDCVLWQMIKASGGLEIQDVVYHERHDAVWCQPGFIDSNPGQIYVRKIAAEWFAAHPSPDMYRNSAGEWCVR